MIQTVLSRVVPAPDSPTADLYFMNACADFLDRGVARLAPTVFHAGDTCLVMRHGLGVQRWPGVGRWVYFVDDAVEAGPRDASLPFLYRQKLRVLERPVGRRLLQAPALTVVSSAQLMRHLPEGVEGRLLHPYWSEPLADLAHFEPAGGAGPIDIAYLGSSVHRADLAFLWPVVAQVLAAHPRARFQLAGRHKVPVALAGHPRILRIPGRGWAAYRAGLAGRRFHLALYPLMDTPFNRARSVNKLIEHGVVGAAPIYSRGWPEAARAEAAGAGLVLRNSAADWVAAIGHLLAHPAVMRGLAACTVALAGRLNRPDPQRRLWGELLQVRLNAAA